MAFFKFRKGGGDESPASPAQAETVEDLRRRARHRLTGAAVLVGIGVIGFPLLFDTQPRPVAVDIPIEIPDRAKARPLPAPVQAPKAQGALTETAKPPVAAAPASAPAAATKAASATVAKAEPAARPADPPKAEAARPADAPKPAPAAKKDDGDRAAALLEGKPVQAAAGGASAAAETRYIVQVGAFSDPAKVRDTRQKVEKAGLKTYTQVADSDKLTRVRVGPFATRAEAEKAASRIKELDLQARVLTL